MVFHGVIDGSLKVYILYALKDKQRKPQELSEKLGFSLATFFKIKKDGFESLKTKKMRVRPGRPVMIDTRMERLWIRQVKILRRKNPNFTWGKLVEACGLYTGQVSNGTVRRVLNKYGFGYRQRRKKRVLSSNDIVCRYRFAKTIRKERSRDVWTSKVKFLLRRSEFLWQKKPCGSGKSPASEYGGLKRRVWHRDARRRGRKGAVVEEFLSFLWLLVTTKGL